MTEKQRQELEDKLWKLYSELIDSFLELLSTKKISVGLMETIVVFLKHNGITIPNRTLDLKSQYEALELPFPDCEYEQ